MTAERDPRRLSTFPVIAAMPAILLLGGCSGIDDDKEAAPRPEIRSSSVAVNREQFLHTWPFTVESVTLSCRQDDHLIAVSPDGEEYAMNDKARAEGLPGPEAIENGEKPPGAVTAFGMGTCTFAK